jgi:hypothetical protein
MQAGEKVYYDLTLVRTNGKKVTAARGIRDQREAEWLVSVVRKGLGKG